MGEGPRSEPPPAVVAAIAGALAVFAAEAGAPAGGSGDGVPGGAPEEAPAGGLAVTAATGLSPWVLAGRLDAILRRQAHARRGGGGR